MQWKDAANEKKKQIGETIPAEWLINAPSPDDGSTLAFPEKSGLLTPEELRITAMSATRLVDAMAARQLSSVAVTTAFCKRAVVAQWLVSPPPYHAEISRFMHHAKRPIEPRIDQLFSRILPGNGLAKG